MALTYSVWSILILLWFAVTENKQQLINLVGCELTQDAEFNKRSNDIHKLVDTGKKANNLYKCVSFERIDINKLISIQTISLCTRCSRFCTSRKSKRVSVVADDTDVRFCCFKAQHLTIPGIV